MKTIYRDYTVVYYFNHSKMGFSNSVTVNAISTDDATNKAIKAVSDCYGSTMLKQFTFKEPTIK
jgi:hypothetical protein